MSTCSGILSTIDSLYWLIVHKLNLYAIGFKKTDVKVLPSDMTVMGLWTDYKDSCIAANQPHKSRHTFRRIWKLVLPMIIISKPSSDLCWTCQQHNYKYSR